jgi:hypothetical protein
MCSCCRSWRRPCPKPDPGRCREILETLLPQIPAGIPEQAIAARQFGTFPGGVDAGDEPVEIAIVVEVADRRAHAVLHRAHGIVGRVDEGTGRIDVVQEQLCRAKIGGNRDVGPEIVVDSRESRRERVVIVVCRNAPELIADELVSVAARKSRLGLKYDLSSYDAAYLWLAAELGAPLATFDQRLGGAARQLPGTPNR